MSGILPGSIPSLVLAVMVKHARKMGATEIHATFKPELNISRASVSTALVEMCKKSVVAKSGGRKDMVYLPTGKKPISRRSKKLIVKPKAIKMQPERETVFNFKNKTAPKVITEEVSQGAAELEKIPKFKMPKAPELIKCNSCEWYGSEKGCPDCRYVLPNEKVAA